MKGLLVFLLFLILPLSSVAMADYTPPFAGHWKDVPDVATSPVLLDDDAFAVSEHNKQTGSGLVYVKVVEGQIWATRMLGTSTYRLLVQARADTNLHKVYKCVVSMVITPTMPKTLRSFEAVLP